MARKTMRTSTPMGGVAWTLLLFVLGIGVALSSRASDIQINPPGTTYQIGNSPLTWAGTGNGSVNNNYWFSPLSNAQSICVYIYNNDTTSAHTFTGQIQYSGNSSSGGPASGVWNSYGNKVSYTTLTAPSAPVVFGTSTSGAVLISINIAGGSGTGNASIFITQTSNGNCMAAGSTTVGTLTSANSGQGSTNPLQIVSDVLAQAYSVSGGLSGTAKALLQVANPSTSTKTDYFDKVYLSASTNTTFTINLQTVPATTCTALTATNLHPGPNAPVTTATTNYDCTSAGTVLDSISYNVLANTTQVVNLAGWIVQSPTGNEYSLTVVDTTGSGTSTAMVQWYEK